MFKERSRINRKNQIVINLIQTPLGYSIVQGDDLINKASTTQVQHVVREKVVHGPPKSNRSRDAGHNVVIPIYPYTNNKLPQEPRQQRHTTLPACASWFSMNSIHENQRRGLPEWFKSKKGASAPKGDRFEKNEELYKKYRNYIVELSKDGYVSATKARKGLAGDACSIMKIHAFLEHWGIINYATAEQMVGGYTHSKQLILRFNEDDQFDMFDYDKGIIPKNYSQDDTEVLKRLTKKFRPNCDFCGQKCGIVWFQHRRSLSSKEISKIMKTVNPKNPVLSATEYEIVLCIRCYSEGFFPIILSSNDFVKMTIQDRLTECKSKKKKVEPPELVAEPQWTVDEVSLLLDLVSKMGDKWTEIASYFPNRTQQEVILCFLSLPLKQISKLKIEMDSEDFVKQNFDELNNNFSDTIAQTALNYIHKHESTTMSNGHTLKVEDTREVEQQRRLFNELLNLYIRKIDSKLELLEEWQSTVLGARKEIEQGRKTVLADKIKNSLK